MRQPRARPEYRAGLARIAPFAPTPRTADARTAAPVGRTAQPRTAGEPVNRRADVLGLQRALAGLGWYAWTPYERSGHVSPALDAALRRFQQANALTVDGFANPDGETLRALATGIQAPKTGVGEGSQPNRSSDKCRELRAERAQIELDLENAKMDIEEKEKWIEELDTDISALIDDIERAVRNLDLVKQSADVLGKALEMARTHRAAHVLIEVLERILRSPIDDALFEAIKQREIGPLATKLKGLQRTREELLRSLNELKKRVGTLYERRAELRERISRQCAGDSIVS